MYYGKIVADPKNPEKHLRGRYNFRVSDDGGRTIRVLGDRNKHVDSHTIWVDPRDTDHIFVGCDGGIYESYDGGQFWQFKANLPSAAVLRRRRRLRQAVLQRVRRHAG